ncbi:MAG: QueT transporter family protein [Clostridia bacterium]|nr:QueT transporter family protein [Clostridia bacterium]
MKSKKTTTQFIVEGALIAALYTGLTYLCAVFSLAYGPVQFRFSEAMTVLPILTPAAIPGLTVGCLLSNIGSFNPLDMIFGTAATLLAAVLTYLMRKLPAWVAILPPVIINAIVIGIEITLFFTDATGSGKIWSFVPSALSVGAGELVVCYALGLPLLILAKKYRLFSVKE